MKQKQRTGLSVPLFFYILKKFCSGTKADRNSYKEQPAYKLLFAEQITLPIAENTAGTKITVRT